MKHILGLDLGTNSIGWALVDGENNNIVKAGSRIIPMDAATIGDFEKGNLKSPASERTSFRGTRRLYERAILRRQRLLRVLNTLDFLPEHFKKEIDWADHPGQFMNDSEPLLPYRRDASGKNEFIFKDSFHEMLADFAEHQPQLVANGKKVPYDWTIYYLRKKAMTKPILRQELAWIILNFNTKRGYYQLRGMEDETKANDNEEYKILEVTNVEQTNEDKKRKGVFWFKITYENGATQRKSGVTAPYKVGDKVEVIVTTTYDKEGKVKIDKEGDPQIKISAPKPDEWILLKKRSEMAIHDSGKTVGEYIYDELLANPNVTVRGKLVRVIDRHFYKEELREILETQKKYIPELQDKNLLQQCVRELYHNNDAHFNSLIGKTFTDLFIDDIIFYQRPLKSKKSEIADCKMESYQYIDKETGEIVTKRIKCISKSHPLYQEFRLWQFIQDLRIYEREKEVNGKMKTDVDVTSDFLSSTEDIEKLFEWLYEKKEISQKELLKYKPFGFGKNAGKYRWNYVEDKTYPCCETHHEIMSLLAKTKDCPQLSRQQENNLWHILYSVDDLIILEKALSSFAKKNNIDSESFVANFVHMKPFESDYGAYSEKAIKKLLPLMRTGKFWSEDNIDKHTKERISHLIDGTADDTISEHVREKTKGLNNIQDFQYLPKSLAGYVVYDRHSESSDTSKWQTPEDIDRYLKDVFKQHSLRNPVVEAVLGETIRVVRDVWKTYGEISEIHVEMGRDLKKNNKERKEASERMQENEKRNLRIRLLLQEFINPEYKIEGVRPYSPSQQEILKIFEENALANIGNDKEDEDMQLIADNLGNSSKHVEKKDIMRYRLWLEQKYKSPYTGQVIPLSKLFTHEYEIEHVIPQSRYFDDSLSNKVICESEVNKLKDRMLGYEFVSKHGGEIITGNMGKKLKILDKVQYEDFVKQHYANNRTKMKKLLMEDIPDKFIERQLNDSRYIARKTIEILSHLVREDGEKEATSKNVIATNGSITDRLKKEWGINDVWNDIVAPRFERLNKITDSHDYGEFVEKNGKRYFQINVPLEISKGFNKKRIDHRHHAMDAIIIACTTRSHINYLNNQAALSDKRDKRYDLQRKLCTKTGTDDKGNYKWQFNKPWETFTQDVRKELSSIVVSFKQNLRVINKNTNFYWHYENGKKVLARQTKGDGWAIRKSLHKASVSGAVRLQTKKKVKLSEAIDNWHYIADKEIKNDIKRLIKVYHRFDKKIFLKYYKDRQNKIGKKDISRVEIYFTPEKAELSAKRTQLDTTFDKKTIEKITDTGIQKILLKHLENNSDDPKIAFTPEGIAKMNDNIEALNNGKKHKPIVNVRITESFGLKFAVGEKGNKQKKFVEADKGTNLFFAIYADQDGKRSFESIPFNIAAERQKKGVDVAPETNEKGEKLLFILSPGDLVYVPEEGEHVTEINDLDRVYKMVSASERRCFFIPECIATIISTPEEFGSQNKIEKTSRGESIKNVCCKLQVNRLGIITKIIR